MENMQAPACFLSRVSWGCTVRLQQWVMAMPMPWGEWSSLMVPWATTVRRQASPVD